MEKRISWKIEGEEVLEVGVGTGKNLQYSILVFISAFTLMRGQTTIDDVDYMEGMIPHHSIAILTSKRAKITDPRVRELADEIIQAQEREITEMKKLIEDLKDE